MSINQSILKKNITNYQKKKRCQLCAKCFPHCLRSSNEQGKVLTLELFPVQLSFMGEVSHISTAQNGSYWYMNWPM